MSAQSSSAVTIEGGEITIAAHLVAQKLGLGWKEAPEVGIAPPVTLQSTHEAALDVVDLADLKTPLA